jgi:signal transduction histidine kinase
MECVRLRSELRRAGLVLHDDIGSLLAVAGLRLQLAKMDYPEAAVRLAEIGEVLEGVVGHVRKLSRGVEPSPVRRTGLKNALLDLAEAAMEASRAESKDHPRAGISVSYSVAAELPPEISEAIYLATAAVIRDAVARKGAGRIAISAGGSKKIAVRVSHHAPAPARSARLQAAALLARAAGLSFEVASGRQTKHGTIVAIQYAL